MAIHFMRSLVRSRLAVAAFSCGVSCIAWLGWCAASVGAETKPVAACQIGEAGRHDTQVNWVASLEQASKQAKADGKLVFLMQVSGNFAREEFT